MSETSDSLEQFRRENGKKIEEKDEAFCSRSRKTEGGRNREKSREEERERGKREKREIETRRESDV